MTISAMLESLLYASGQPVSIKKLAQVLDLDVDAIYQGLQTLRNDLERDERGFVVLITDSTAELVTHPEMAQAIRTLLDVETQGELSKASMEALSIIAYRGPMTRPELEQIRGIQSSMVIRHLLLRGLIEQRDEQRLGQPVYAVTSEFFKHIGYTSAEELPDYELLRNHHAVTTVLEELEAPTQPSLQQS